MSIGTTLKAARERSGLTIAQVAEQTRMIHQLVEDIEQDDFHRIVAAVYGRGFIKLFAECVGEDPAPLVQEFNELFSGARRPAVRTRPVQTASKEPETVEAEDSAPHRPKVRAVTVPDEEPQPAGRDAPTARPQLPPRPDTDGRFVETSLPEAKPSSDTLGRDAPTARPQLPPRAPLPPPQPELQPEPEVTPPPRQEVKPVAAEVKQPPKPKDIVEPVTETDESGLGGLFDLGRRSQPAPHPEKARSNPDSPVEAPSLNMPLTQQAPSWDDAPISNGDFWQKIYSLNKWKYWKVGAAVAGLCLLAVVVLGIVSSRRGRQLGDENVTAVPSGTSAESTTPAPVASPASKDPKAANPGTDGKSVYTDNLVPPPDSYVD